ncbi:MAG: RNA methyltransferase [Candidatus Krumholzibacteriia bacterium]
MSERLPPLTSLQNPRVKALVKLRQHRERERRRLTLLEEPLVIRRALEAGYPLQEVWVCPERLVDVELADLAAELERAGVPVQEAAGAVLDKVSYRGSSDGLLAVAPQRRRLLADLQLGQRPLLVVLLAVEKPGNLGAVLRTADACGCDAVLVGDPGTDLYNPNVVRASRGALFTVPAVADTAAAVLAFLGERGIVRIAATPDASEPYTGVDLTGPTALVLGPEHGGLSAAHRQECDRAVRVPMLGVVDSLNVATTAAVVLYEALRQRGAGAGAGTGGAGAGPGSPAT